MAPTLLDMVRYEMSEKITVRRIKRKNKYKRGIIIDRIIDT